MEKQEERSRCTVIFRDRFTNKIVDVKVMVEAPSKEPEFVKKMRELLY